MKTIQCIAEEIMSQMQLSQNRSDETAKADIAKTHGNLQGHISSFMRQPDVQSLAGCSGFSLTMVNKKWYLYLQNYA